MAGMEIYGILTVYIWPVSMEELHLQVRCQSCSPPSALFGLNLPMCQNVQSLGTSVVSECTFYWITEYPSGVTWEGGIHSESRRRTPELAENGKVSSPNKVQIEDLQELLNL